MRGRIGGRIGATVLPSGSSAKGVWGLGEMYVAVRNYIGYGYDYGYESSWPMGTISISWPYIYYQGYQDYADVTSGSGTFSPELSTTYPSLAYSWQKSTDSGATWTTVSGETEATITLTGQTTANDGEKYRLVANAGLKVVYGPAGTVQCDTVTVSFYSNPTSQFSTTTAYFDVGAQASGVTYGRYYEPTYQWQRSTNGGSSWSNLSGETNSYLSFSVTAGMDGYKYRCVASFAGQSATSTAATLIYG